MNIKSVPAHGLSYLTTSWDAYRAAHQGAEGIARRQHKRLHDLVEYARTRSPYYAKRYRGVPESVSDTHELPAVTKAELMGQFDDWVTDPLVARSDVEKRPVIGLMNCHDSGPYPAWWA